ncbi:hypothetical protein CDN99_12125 [Roseateles aquatilis]|uniref:Ice-binding protein C-terminal domain-containing protein n=1 Tax=Roseateles aquatilis TaxID=431061 RepID=A0A246JEB1_9BURK|nr:PEP-CTERM sorting domain-containing protein [Roseateles aquatilis]OWQ90900.1 hypothetical protein CDN99_12125 [Roseateles aquatilis]
MNLKPLPLKPWLAAAALALSSLAAQAATVSLQTAGPAQVGGGVDLLISVIDPFGGRPLDEELLSFGFRLSYDTTRLSLAGFTPVAGWDDDSPWLGAGQFGASRFPGLGNAGQASLLLGTLHFDALQGGLAQISLISDAGNLNHGLSYLWSNVQPINASLALPVSAVPEPTSALLAALGLGGLAMVGRRRQAGR